MVNQPWENDWRTPHERQEEYEVQMRLDETDRRERAKKLRDENQAKILAKRPWRQRKFSWAYDFSYGVMFSGQGMVVIIIACVIGVLALCCGIGMPLDYANSKYECRVLAESTSNEVQFVDRFPWTWHCYVKVNDQWVPYEKWIANSGN